MLESNINDLFFGMLENALQQGILPSIIVAIYLIAIKLIESKRKSEAAKINSTIVESINDISIFLKHITKDIIDKESLRCQSAVKTSFESFENSLITFVSSTIVNNHIDVNKENIILNVNNIINSGYYSIVSELSLYKVNGKEVSAFLRKEWMQEIEKDVIYSIYNTNLNKEEKIVNFNNKIDIRIQKYVTYVLNNIK